MYEWEFAACLCYDQHSPPLSLGPGLWTLRNESQRKLAEFGMFAFGFNVVGRPCWHESLSCTSSPFKSSNRKDTPSWNSGRSGITRCNDRAGQP